MARDVKEFFCLYLRQQLKHGFAWPGDDVSRDEFSQALNFGFPGFNGSSHGGQLALNDDGDVTATEFFFAEDFNTGGFTG